MARSGLTREAKRAKIRQDLIRAATELFAERGYWSVSLDEIAERADLTKGAVYSNFAGKEELLVAVVSQLEAADDVDVDADLNLEEQLRSAGRQTAGLVTSEAMRRLAPREIELVSLALSSPAVRGTMAKASLAQQIRIAAYIRQAAARDNIELAYPPEELAAILLAVRRGLIQHAVLYPEAIPAQYFEDALAIVLAGAANRAGKTRLKQTQRSQPRSKPPKRAARGGSSSPGGA